MNGAIAARRMGKCKACGGSVLPGQLVMHARKCGRGDLGWIHAHCSGPHFRRAAQWRRCGQLTARGEPCRLYVVPEHDACLYHGGPRH